MSTLENRLQKLEKRERIYQIAFLSVILAGAFFTITAFNKKSQAPDLIQAKEFQVVDDNGKVFASMKAHDGFVDFKMYNSSGKSIMRLTESNAGTGTIITSNKNGNMACQMISYDDGSGKFELYNNNGTMVTTLGSNALGGGYLGLKNPDEKIVCELNTTDRKTGFLGINNADGSELFKVTYSNGDYGGWMGLSNGTGKNVFIASCGSDGDGSLSLYNRNNIRTSFLGNCGSGDGCLNIYDSYGQNLNGVWHK